MLCSLYTYCTSSILGLHDIVFVLLVSTLIAIRFSIDKKWKTDNKQFLPDILMLCNEEVNNIPYSCFLSRWIFLRTDIRNTNTCKLSKNGHEFSIEVGFFVCQVFDLQLHFFFSDRFRCWKMKKETFCWEAQSKHYFDINKKCISPFLALFFPGKRFYLRNRC